MKRFSCTRCGNTVHFENSGCVQCKSALGFLPSACSMYALETDGDALRLVGHTGADRFIVCENADVGACNWLAPADSASRRCYACRNNRMIPDLSTPQNVERWRRIEQAKRRLFYALLRWRLPSPDRLEDAQSGLAFDFLADLEQPDGSIAKVLTGHDSGVITLNIAEADDGEREMRRAAMGEPYRTLLGHMRHEIGHYYWDRLVRDGGRLDEFRALFGDERQDYAAALQTHYENGPRGDWANGFISSYAGAHPWEDFAETWAHYMHIVDALETSRAFGVAVADVAEGEETRVVFDPYRARDAQALVNAWAPLTIAVNALNRSMGQPDLYPFVLSIPVVAKLQFIHEIVQAQTRSGAAGAL